MNFDNAAFAVGLATLGFAVILGLAPGASVGLVQVLLAVVLIAAGLIALTASLVRGRHSDPEKRNQP